MKALLFSLLFLVFSLPLFSQVGTQIDYEDNFGPLVLDYNGMVNGKESYQGTDGFAVITVSWTGTRWEIYIDVGSGDVLSFSSDVNTVSNPPDFTVGNWVDEAADGTDLLGFSGTGTTQIILPIKLVEFTATKVGKKAVIEWVTASEFNNSHFEIQYSKDGMNFQTFTRINGSGDTNLERSYEVTHHPDYFGKYYYRFMQVDFDGEIFYSPVRSLEFTPELGLVLVPNPVVNQIQVATEDVNPFSKIVITSIQGEIVYEIELNENVNEFLIDVSRFDPSLYIITVTGENYTQTSKFVKS